MMKLPFLQQKPQKIISDRWVIRFLCLLVVILSLTAGYYFTQFQYLQEKYLQLENTKLELIEIPTTQLP